MHPGPHEVHLQHIFARPRVKSPKRLRNLLPGKPEFAEVRLTSTESPDSRLSPQALHNHNQHMRMSHKQGPPNANRLSAAALAAFGAASAIPIPLAQLDFAGLINVFNIDNGHSPPAVIAIASLGGALTVAVIALALVGSWLAATGATSARATLITAALAGLVTATPLWIPAGVLIGAAAVLLGAPQNDECEPTCRNLRWASGVDARDLRRGET